jgi:serine/threonine protein kinase
VKQVVKRPGMPSCSDYRAAIASPLSIKDPSLKGGKPVEQNNRLVMYTGGFCVVFPFHAGNKKYAIRCWHVRVHNVRARIRIISKKLRELHLPYFVEFTFKDKAILTVAGLQPIVKMEWVDAYNLKKYVAKNRHDQLLMKKLAASFLEMVKVLHRNRISHGDLQHGNVLVKNDGSLVLVDYDSMYIPELAGQKEEIKGLPGYQHPARYSNVLVTPYADYFSELVIYLSILALIKIPELWNELKIEDSEEMVFSGKDFVSKGSSPIFKRLLRCNDSIIKSLTKTLIDFCCKLSILDLKPLEEVVHPPVSTGTAYIKWAYQFIAPKKVPTSILDIKSISDKW